MIVLLLALDLVAGFLDLLFVLWSVCFDVARYVLFGFYGYFCGLGD